MFCLCISQFGFVNKVLLPCVADKWHSVCEKCTYKTIVKKSNLAIAAAPSRNTEKVYFSLSCLHTVLTPSKICLALWEIFVLRRRGLFKMLSYISAVLRL